MTPANKGVTYDHDWLRKGEPGHLLKVCSRKPTGRRDAALIAVLWRAGLRCQEALNLLPDDLDPADGMIRVRNGKGGKTATVGMDPLAFEVVARWMDVREKILERAHPVVGSVLMAQRAPVFCGLTRGSEGQPMDSSNVRRKIKTLGRRAGITRRIHPHMLRHTLAHEMALEGKPMPIIQRQLRHENLETTAIYLQSLAPSEVVEAMQGREWG